MKVIIFLIFRNFSRFFLNFSEFLVIFKDFSEIFKCAGGVTRFESSDHIAINGQGGEVMWQPVEHSIAQRIVIVDLHLKCGVRGTS